jgi:hypothetical protein
LFLCPVPPASGAGFFFPGSDSKKFGLSGLACVARSYAARQIIVDFRFDVAVRALRDRNAFGEKAPGLKSFALIVPESDSLLGECFGGKNSM